MPMRPISSFSFFLCNNYIIAVFSESGRYFFSKDSIVAYLTNFYPTALKRCRGIVFTHGVRMGGWAAGKVCPGCISETVRCRKFILGRDIV